MGSESFKFRFAIDYILEDEIVRLSPLRVEHIEPLTQQAADAEIWTYFLENGFGVDNLTAYIHSAIDQRKLNKEYPFVVFDKRKNQYAGITRLYDWIPELRNIKLGHTWYGKNFHGTGLNKHCKYLLFQFAFESLEAERIGFGVHAENIRSIYALKSIGCQQEGKLRNFLITVDQQGRTDLLYFSMLRAEWMTEGKERLSAKLIAIQND